MGTTGTFEFDPKIDEVIAEAGENAGVDPAAIGASFLDSVYRSMRLMLNSEWATHGVRQWTIEEGQQVMKSVGMSSFVLPLGAVNIIEAVLRRGGKDTEMYPMSQNEYLTIVDKTTQGRPDRWHVERKAGRLGRTVRFWRTASNTTDIIVYNYFRQLQDAMNEDTDLASGLDLPAHAFDAMVDGLSMRLAKKFNTDRYDLLRVAYGGSDYPSKVNGGSLKRMLDADRDEGDIELIPQFEPRTGRR
jgi:hypothetical protein